MKMNNMIRRFSSKAANCFDWMDPLKWKKLLSSEELMLHDAAYDFCNGYLLPKVINASRNESYDENMMLEFGRMGYLGCTLTGYGCAGVGNVAYGLICNAVEAIDSSNRSSLSVQSSLVMGAIYYHGSDYQKSKYLPELAKGKLIGCFGLTEPDHGSDPSGMTTRARKLSNGNYLLSGSKTWITHAPVADVMIIWAKDDEDVIRGFIVDRDLAGISTPSIEGKMSLRASCTGSIFLEDVEVSSSALLPGCAGLAGPLSCLNNARYGIAWGALGAAESCYKISRDYSMQRSLFNSQLAGKQIVQKKLADMATDLSLGYLAAVQVGRLMENNSNSHTMISMIKRNNCAKASEIARNARDILGGNGISDNYHVIRHMMNLEAVNTYEGTSDIHALIIGQGITGIAAF